MREKWILLVEDNPDDEALTLRALRRSHVLNDIVVQRDGQQALDFLFGQGEHSGRDVKDHPQVVLLDVKLPKIDGLEVLKRLRENPLTEFLPIVLLTSSAEERDLIEAYRLGANSYVRKPVDFVQFAEAAQQLGMYWLVLNQTPQR